MGEERGYRRRDRNADSDDDCKITDGEQQHRRQERRRQQRRQRQREQQLRDGENCTRQGHSSPGSSAGLLTTGSPPKRRQERIVAGTTHETSSPSVKTSRQAKQTSSRHRSSRDRSRFSNDQDRERQRRRRQREDGRHRGGVVEVVRYSDSGEDEDEDEDNRRRRRHRQQQGRLQRTGGDRHVRSSAPRNRPAAAMQGLSAMDLAALDAMNEKIEYYEDGEAGLDSLRRQEEGKRRRKEQGQWRRRQREDEGEDEKVPDVYDEFIRRERRYEVDYVDGTRGERLSKEAAAVTGRRRIVSGQRLEKGSGLDGGEKRVTRLRGFWPFGGAAGDGRRGTRIQRKGGTIRSEYSELSADERAQVTRRRRKMLMIAGIVLLIIAIAVAIGVSVSRKEAENSSDAARGGVALNGHPDNSNLKGMDPNSVPDSLKGGWMDPFSWYDTTDFNVTFTGETVGGLPVIGLMSGWDDSTRANEHVPALDERWEYGKMAMRGINVGGWLVNEPLITPSFYSRFKTSDGVVDEWTLAAKLPPASVRTTFETHYASFITERDFLAMQQAGFDHVRIPFGYWAVATYQGDPYVAQVSWRYLLRAIEWARRYGLRINLDLHGAPGSQNGWNHSGKQGQIGWLNGTDGSLNGMRTIQIHDQLSKFFAQPRYRNIISVWGLVNEPRMTALDASTVLQWTRDAVSTVRGNGITAVIAFGDGFMGLDKWQGRLQDIPGLVLDVHQYVIFNVQQIALDHKAKVKFACGGWTAQAERSMDKATGFGPTITAEWSQADTDCATYLNNVGVGSRWEGTLNFAGGQGGSVLGSVLTPTCPTGNNPRCSCSEANADPEGYPAAYKRWLRDFAEAQMDSFEKGWGWFYWTWKTETNTQWSYSDGLKAGILPGKTWGRAFHCDGGSVPDYAGMGLPENY